MNNIVEITYQKGARYPVISINGEQISRYMELSDLIYDDIFNWGGKLFTSMDEELCEQYTIYLTGHPFHNRVLRSLQETSGYCTAIRFTPIEYKLSIADKMAYADTLNQKYSLGIFPEGDHVVFSSDEPDRFRPWADCTAEPGNYYITTGDQFPATCKYCITLGEQLRFEKVRGVSYLTVTEDVLGELVDYLNLYHFCIKYTAAVFGAAAELVADPAEKLKLEAYSTEEYRVLAAAVPEKLECGQSYTLTYTYYPEQFEDPNLFARSGNPAVVATQGNTLIACAPGSAAVQLVDKFGSQYGAGMITVEQHNYVTSISIVLPDTSMCVNDTLNFKCLVAPNDAEDVNSLHFTTSDSAVAVISGKGELYALSAGRVKITASTSRCSTSFYISVLPAPQEILLPQEELELPLNADAQVCCTVAPPNASPMPAATWTSSNPRIVKVMSVGSYCCTLRSLNEGTALITCALEGTDIVKTMQVTVKKPRGCYVATAVYGSYDCPQVWVLRRYRDQFLAERRFGRAFIRVYYALSPTAVKLFGKTKWFNRLWRGVLDGKIRKLKACGYEDTPYHD